MKTINLLPQSRKRLLKDEAVYRSLLNFMWLTVFSFVVVLAAQFMVKIYLQSQDVYIHESVKSLQEKIKKNENSDIKSKINVINGYITDYNNLAINTPKWSKVVKAFAVLPPDGITINTMSINLANKTVNITGNSPTREQVIQLYNNILADDSEFYNIDYPFENVAKPVNISFHFTFSIRDSLLK